MKRNKIKKICTLLIFTITMFSRARYGYIGSTQRYEPEEPISIYMTSPVEPISIY